MRPRESFFLVREFFLAKDLANDFNMRFPREINIGFAKDSRKYGFFCEEWPFANKGFGKNAINKYI